jgi:hypothetical protein
LKRSVCPDRSPDSMRQGSGHIRDCQMTIL